jgi:endonuclease/exonuclease/phosphatase family metal-dependent hydrolase
VDLTVCTYNVLHGTAPRQNERYDFTALLGLDIVGFQEADRDPWWAALRKVYVSRFRGGRGPLRENAVAWSTLWTIKASGSRMTHRGLAGVSPHRGFTWVLLEREGVTVGVLDTHLVSGVRGKGKRPVTWRRNRWQRHMVALRVQVAKLLSTCDHVIVLGDFNETGPHVTIPGLKRVTPADSIDHIFVSPGLHCLGVVNLARRGSDHAPRVATLTTRPVIPTPPKPDPEVTPVDPEIAIARARAMTKGRTMIPGGAGWCLREVRQLFSVPVRDPDASTAWRNAKHKHPTEQTANIPRGVPVFWTGGSKGHGHIAISAGDGDCYTTDYPESGRWGWTKIDTLTRRWGLDFQGWTEDLNGYRVWSEPEPPKPPKPKPVPKPAQIRAAELVAMILTEKDVRRTEVAAYLRGAARDLRAGKTTKASK